MGICKNKKAFEATMGINDSTLKPDPRAGVLVLRKNKNKHDERPTVTEMWTSWTGCVTVNASTVIHVDSKNKKNALLRHHQKSPVITWKLHPV